jgi:hypothetical protein
VSDEILASADRSATTVSEAQARVGLLGRKFAGSEATARQLPQTKTASAFEVATRPT